MEQKLCLRGVTFKVHWELVEVDAPTFARFEGRGPMRSKAVIENRLERRDGKTHYEYRNEFKAPLGPLGTVAKKVLVGGIPEKEARASLARLKRDPRKPPLKAPVARTFSCISRREIGYGFGRG